MSGQFSISIFNGQMMLSPKWNVAHFKLNGQCLLINRLQKSTSEPRVNFHRGSDDGMRSWISFLFHLRHLRNLRIT